MMMSLEVEVTLALSSVPLGSLRVPQLPHGPIRATFVRVSLSLQLLFSNHVGIFEGV